jgi:hypothetical protein
MNTFNLAKKFMLGYMSRKGHAILLMALVGRKKILGSH